MRRSSEWRSRACDLHRYALQARLVLSSGPCDQRRLRAAQGLWLAHRESHLEASGCPKGCVRFDKETTSEAVLLQSADPTIQAYIGRYRGRNGICAKAGE